MHDIIVAASVAGRVACTYATDYGTDLDNGFHYVDEGNGYYMNAVSGATYFAIEHDGDETARSDINGRPIYVLADGRLARQYIYYDEDGAPAYSNGLAQADMRRADVHGDSSGRLYSEIRQFHSQGGCEASMRHDGAGKEGHCLKTHRTARNAASATATLPLSIEKEYPESGNAGKIFIVFVMHYAK